MCLSWLSFEITALIPTQSNFCKFRSNNQCHPRKKLHNVDFWIKWNNALDVYLDSLFSLTAQYMVPVFVFMAFTIMNVYVVHPQCCNGKCCKKKNYKDKSNLNKHNSNYKNSVNFLKYLSFWFHLSKHDQEVSATKSLQVFSATLGSYKTFITYFKQWGFVFPVVVKYATRGHSTLESTIGRITLGRTSRYWVKRDEYCKLKLLSTLMLL